jgi:imidazolonepropionase-like amidohydrolase
VVFNLGEAVKANSGGKDKAPGTRMATAAIIRQALLDARAYAAADDSEDKVDLDKQALARLLAGELPALFTVHREDDIATAIRIAAEFELELWLHYATEGYLVRDLIRASGARVLLGPTMLRLEGIQGLNASLENPALLHRAGVPISFATGHEGYVPKSRVLLFEMAIAVANGLPARAAIEAATIDAARLLGVDGRIGSIERGKDADLVLFDGDPFEYTSQVQAVIIDGRVTAGETH